MGRAPDKKYLALSNAVRASLAGKADVFRIQYMSKDELLRIQVAIGYGDTWGTINVPAERLPPGAGRGAGTRVIEMRKHLQGSHSSEEVDAYLTTVTRFVLLSFLVPQVSPSTGTIALSDSTMCSLTRHACRLANMAMQHKDGDAKKIMGRLSVQDIASVRNNLKLRPELNRIKSYKERDYWSDVPEFQPENTATDYTAELPVTPSPKSKPFQPFPDDFTAALGWRCAWLVENLGPSLLRLLQDLFPGQESWLERGYSPREFSEFVQSKLARFIWKDKNGKRLDKLPFTLSIKGSGNQAIDWPPRYFGQIKVLVGAMQCAHMTITLATTGGRISEVLSVDGSSLREDKRGTVVVGGKTYKLVFDEEGAARDWPLSPIGVEAISNQVKIKQYFSCLNLGISDEDEEAQDEEDEDEKDAAQSKGEALENNSASIWGIVGDSRELVYPGEMVSRLVERLELKALLKGTNAHPHRFRKTLARIVGLALVGAPKILMDLFGHKQIEMSLAYMLSNPSFRAEIEEAAKAETIMNAAEMLKDVDNAGGAAARKVRDAMVAEAAHLSTDFGEDDLVSLAETFTMGGKSWLLVRPGVVCIKTVHDVGPCSKSRGHPDPASCKTDCGHRFEDAFLKNDVDESINQAIRHYEKCDAEGDLIGSAEWAGQIEANLGRFPSIKEQFLNHPIVLKIQGKEFNDVARC